MDQCSSVVELTISCNNLPDMDIISKSDPMCVVFLKHPTLNSWKEIGRTETVWDNLNPEFSRKITLTYMFEQRQQLRFELYDIDSDSTDLSKHDFLGRLDVTLGEIVATSSFQHFVRPLSDGPKQGIQATIKILAEEVSSCKEEFNLKFDAQCLPTGWFSQNAFFYEIHKSMEHTNFNMVYRSPVVKSHGGNCGWHQVTLNTYSLCNGDFDRNIKLTLKKFKSNGSHKVIGEYQTNIRNMVDVMNSGDKMAMKFGKSTFRLCYLSKGSHASFLDFIKIG